MAGPRYNNSTAWIVYCHEETYWIISNSVCNSLIFPPSQVHESSSQVKSSIARLSTMRLSPSVVAGIFGLLSLQAVHAAPTPEDESPATTPSMETDGVHDPIRGGYVFDCHYGVSVSDCKSWNADGPGGYCSAYSSTPGWHSTSSYWYGHCKANCYCRFVYN
jgi:hypothetical protein